MLHFRNQEGIITPVFLRSVLLGPPLLWPLYHIHAQVIKQLPNDMTVSTGAFLHVMGRPCPRLRLVFAGAVLDDVCRTLADYKVQARDTLDYALKEDPAQFYIVLPTGEVLVCEGRSLDTIVNVKAYIAYMLQVIPFSQIHLTQAGEQP